MLCFCQSHVKIPFPAAAQHLCTWICVNWGGGGSASLPANEILNLSTRCGVSSTTSSSLVLSIGVGTGVGIGIGGTLGALLASRSIGRAVRRGRVVGTGGSSSSTLGTLGLLLGRSIGSGRGAVGSSRVVGTSGGGSGTLGTLGLLLCGSTGSGSCAIGSSSSYFGRG